MALGVDETLGLWVVVSERVSLVVPEAVPDPVEVSVDVALGVFDTDGAALRVPVDVGETLGVGEGLVDSEAVAEMLGVPDGVMDGQHAVFRPRSQTLPYNPSSA